MIPIADDIYENIYEYRKQNNNILENPREYIQKRICRSLSVRVDVKWVHERPKREEAETSNRNYQTVGICLGNCKEHLAILDQVLVEENRLRDDSWMVVESQEVQEDEEICEVL